MRKDSPQGDLIASFKLKRRNTSGYYVFEIPSLADTENLCFVFKGKKANMLELDSFMFK